MNAIPEKIVEVINPGALTVSDLEITVEQDGILVFDLSTPDNSFFVRYEKDGTIKFHEFPGVNTRPRAMEMAKEAGFNITSFQQIA